MPWLSFSLAAAALAIFLFVPGTLVLKSLRFETINAIQFSPIISGFAYAVLAVVFPYIGIKASWASLFLPLLIIGIVTFGIRVARENRRQDNRIIAVASRRQWEIFLLYPLLGVLSFSWLYLAQLPDPDAIIQQIDNTFHISLIYAFFVSGDYSPLHCTLYPEVTQGSYYPALFHEFGAVAMSATGCGAGIAENAALFAFIALVFPCGMHALLTSLAPENEPLALAGAFATVLFKGFAANMLIWTVLPNAIGYCYIPATIAALAIACSKQSIGYRIAHLTLVLLSCILCAFTHPLALFALIVLVFPYLLTLIWRLPIKATPQLPRPYFIKAVLIVAICIAFAIVWYLGYYSPYLLSVTQMMWPGFSTPDEAVLNTLFLAYRPISIAQPVLAVVVFIGIIYTFRQREFLWLSLSFVIASLIYGIGVGSNGMLKQILTGYWYTDTIRIGAYAAIAAMPLAAFGFSWLGSMLAHMHNNGSADFDRNVNRAKWQHTVSCLALSIIILLPNSLIPFATDLEPVDTGYHLGDFTRMKTSNMFSGSAFSAAKEELFQLTRLDDNTLTQEELDFGSKVASIVPPNARIANSAYDGSMFLYPLRGLNLCYRRNATSCPFIKDNEVFRLHLNEFAINRTVQELVKDAGVEYVLLLDNNDSKESRELRFLGRRDGDWTGIEAINGNTPGFETVLEDGDKHLYRILTE